MKRLSQQYIKIKVPTFVKDSNEQPFIKVFIRFTSVAKGFADINERFCARNLQLNNFK